MIKLAQQGAPSKRGLQKGTTPSGRPEATQRDVNIGLVNELALLCRRHYQAHGQGRVCGRPGSAGGSRRSRIGHHAPVDQPATGQHDTIILAVPHRDLLAMGPDGIRELGTPGSVRFDVKPVFEPQASDLRL